MNDYVYGNDKQWMRLSAQVKKTGDKDEACLDGADHLEPTLSSDVCKYPFKLFPLNRYRKQNYSM